ncbi:MAG: phosphonate ABC transporter, permease protein PhnE [Candidatus Kapaibacterium sp.]
MSRRPFFYTLLLLSVAFTIWSFQVTEFSLAEIYKGFFVRDAFGQFLSGLWPFNWEILGEVAWQALVTVQIAWVGTLLSLIVALPLSFLAARNASPSFFLGLITRFFFNFDRSIDVLIIALIFVSAIGLGPLAGALAIAFHSIGSLGKLFTEAIESTDRGPIEALESVGANRAQVVRWGVIPQVLPYLISYTLYRLELNIRSAVVLGIVGAGGIGFLLLDNIRQFQYQNVSMILVVIIILVLVMDWGSGKLRKSV